MLQALKLTLISAAAVGWLGVAGARAHPASGLVADAEGRVYFSDLETVWRLDARGALSVFRPGVGGRHVHELALDPDGNLYGADLTYEPSTQKWITALWRMTPAGVFNYLVAPTERPPRGLGVARDRRGNTYSVEQNNHTKRETLLLKRTPGGEVSLLAGGAYGHADGRGRAARFGSVGALASGPDETLYLTDGTTVRRVWPDGTVRTHGRAPERVEGDAAASGHDHHAGFYGLAVDAAGRVYVADHGRRRVLKFAPGGEPTSLLRAEPPWSPTGVAVAADGRLFVLEVGPPSPTGIATRVRQLSPDGAIRVLATVGAKEAGAAPASRTAAPAGGTAPPAEEATTPAVGETKRRSSAAIARGRALYLGLGALAIAALAGLRLRPRRRL